MKTTLISGWACRALVVPARAFSRFHSVGTCCTSSMMSPLAFMTSLNPSVRLRTFSSVRLPTSSRTFSFIFFWRA